MARDVETAPFPPILDALQRDEPHALERLLASGFGATRLAAIRDCFDWNGHQVKTAPTSEVPDGTGPAVIETFTEAQFAAYVDGLFTEAAAAVTDRIGRLLLCLWVRQSCRKAWGHTYRSDQILGTLAAFNEAAHRAWDAESDPFLGLALRCNDLLHAEIHTEDQLHTGSLGLHRAAVERAIKVCEAITDGARTLLEAVGNGEAADDAAVQGITRFIAEQAEARLRFNRAILASNEGVVAAVAGDMARLSREIADIESAASLIPADSYIEQSEIGALQQSLERFTHNRKPWLRIDRGRISYLFPFGITNLEYEEIPARLQTAVEHGPLHVSGENRQAVRPTALSTHFTAHADIWDPHAAQSQRFDGLELSFPDLALDLGDDGTEVLKVSIRFSPMGLHCLRLERPVRDLQPHELSAVLRRPMREHGRISITCPGSEGSWSRISQFARTVLNEDLPRHLRGEAPSGDADPLVHRARPHVLLRIQHASRYRPGSADPPEPVREGSALLGLFGASSLVNATPVNKESIGDWSRLSGGRSKTIRSLRNEGDVLVSNENSTVIAALDTPSHLSAELEALAEFAASFSGALEAWNHRLNEYRSAVADIVDAYDTGAAKDTPELLQRMQQERAQLTRFENETHRVIATLYSPHLLRSSVNTAVLRRLLQNSGTDAHVQAFRERLGEVVADQFEATLQRWEKDRQKVLEDRRAERARKSALARESTSISLAGLGIFSAFQIWQAAGIWSVWSAVTLTVLIFVGGALLRAANKAYGWKAVKRVLTGQPVVAWLRGSKHAASARRRD